MPGRLLLLALALLATGCSGSDGAEPATGGNGSATAVPFAARASDRYADPAMWLCLPGGASNPCATDLTSTRISLDGTSALVRPSDPDPPVDCFYVYPTADHRSEPGNNDPTDGDLTDEMVPLSNQAVPFGSVCRVFAPLYRQMTGGTYGSAEFEEHFDIAYSDVEEAFGHYLAELSEGRSFVLLGHSQGAGMLTRLLQEVVDGSPEIKSRMLSAILAGGEDVLVDKAGSTSPTFDDLPLCVEPTQTGCIVAYNSYLAGDPTLPDATFTDSHTDGLHLACTNPASLAGGSAPLTSAGPAPGLGTAAATGGVSTPFFMLDGLLSATCRSEGAHSWLEISVVSSHPSVSETLTHVSEDDPDDGLHNFDVTLVLGDLIELVHAQTVAHGDG